MRRRRVLRVLAVAVVVVAYVGMLLLYAMSGRTRGVGDTDTVAPAGGAVIALTVEDVDSTTQRLDLTVDLQPDDALVQEGGLALDKGVTVLLDPSAGSREVVFPAGQLPAVTQISMVLNGDIRDWPFDTYRALMVTGAYVGTAEDAQLLPTDVVIRGHVQGWRVAATPTDGPGSGSGLHLFDLDLRRSADTLAFAAIMLGVLVALPVLALFVAVRCYRGDRKVQPTFMSWIAAMLFATIPLRNFLPGSPPPGSWIDAIVVLWVIVGLVLALALYVGAWWREDKRDQRDTRGTA